MSHVTDASAAMRLDADLTINYKLSTGTHGGRFLSELANHRIVGARCDGCRRVFVPADESCARCGADATEMMEVPSTGTLTAFSESDGVVLGLIRLDGADNDLLHRIIGVKVADLAVGQRVEATWASEPTGTILDIEGFSTAADSALGEPSPLPDTDEELVLERPYRVSLNYEHAYGNGYGTLFDELRHTRRIIGSRCPSCHSVLVPPRPVCEVCYVPTAQFEDVADTGVLRAFSVIHLAFEGQTREPPYVYAEITLDGAATRLIHVLGGLDIDKAQETLRPGMPVKAVWKEGSETGTLADIDYFEPIFDK